MEWLEDKWKQLWKCSITKHSCIVKVNVMNRVQLCPLLQVWGGLFDRETLKFLEMGLERVKKY